MVLAVGLTLGFANRAKVLGFGAKTVASSSSAIKVVPAEVVASREGVYILSSTIEKYVGQSQNILKRLSYHFGKNGMFFNNQNVEKLLIKMSGSTRLEREIYEQYLIEKFGITNLKNKVNPMGGRMNIYLKEIENIINKYNLPRY